MKIVFIILGLVDIAAAALIFFPFPEVMLYLMVFMLVKGGFFLLTGLAARNIGLHCMLLCITDTLVGIALGIIAIGYGTPGPEGLIPIFLNSVGIIGVLKGIYTTILPFFS